MDPLMEERAAINEIDREMLVLFQRRMKHSERIAKIKEKSGVAIYVPGREQEILTAAEQTVEESYGNYARQFMQEILRLSKERQQELKKETSEN